MKTGQFASMLLSTLFYTTLLSTMFAVPLVLGVRYHGGIANVDRDAPVWERPPYAPAKVEPPRDLLPPQSDTSVSGPAARRPPMDQSGPDAAMIKPGRARAKTIKL